MLINAAHLHLAIMHFLLDAHLVDGTRKLRMICRVVTESLQVLAHLPVLIHDLHFLLLCLPFEPLNAPLGICFAQRLSLLVHKTRMLPISRMLQAQLFCLVVLALETHRELLKLALVGHEVLFGCVHLFLQFSSHVVELLLLRLAKPHYFLLVLLHLGHEGADAAVLALLPILYGTIVVFVGATVELGCAHLLILQRRFRSLAGRSEALIDLTQGVVDHQIVHPGRSTVSTIMRGALLREHSHLGTCRAAVVVELPEVLQREHSLTLFALLQPLINLRQMLRVGVERTVVLSNPLLLDQVQLALARHV